MLDTITAGNLVRIATASHLHISGGACLMPPLCMSHFNDWQLPHESLKTVFLFGVNLSTF